MTDADIPVLVARLRAMAQGEARSGIGRQRWVLFRDAADALEARQDWATIINHLDDKLAAALLRADKAEQRLAELEARRS